MDPASPLQPYVPAAGAPQATPVPSQPVAPAMPMPSITQQAPLADTNPALAQAPFSATTTNPYAPPMPPAPQMQMSAMPQQPMQAAPVGLKSQVVEDLKKANNVLVTVSNNPSVDQLSAAIGLTLALNKLDKHATAVFSGATPSTIEFLQPEKTIEKNTDSLRDFIIALDKAKADKLRYKVEDKFVKIFITPYHTSLSEGDLEFSQGDFNVDVVVAIGVHQREELDQAITSHGRILHDAVTVSINNKQSAELGAVNWYEGDASSLCEMIVGLIEPLQGNKVILDNQIATAFLTGIVAETQRFSNTKTTAHTMNVSATLMKAGANQQLVASKLEAPKPVPEKDKTFDAKKMDELAKSGAAPTDTAPTPRNDGSLSIPHKEDKNSSKTLDEIAAENENYSNDPDQPDSDLAKIHIDNEGRLLTAEQEKEAKKKAEAEAEEKTTESKMALTPPSINGDLNATDISERPPAETTEMGTMTHGKKINPISESQQAPVPGDTTLKQLEEKVHSPHLQPVSEAAVPSEQAARASVSQATAAVDSSTEPIAALNAMPIDLNKEAPAAAPTAPATSTNLTTEQVFPTQLVKPDTGVIPDPNAGAANPTAPPLVPPPLMPPQS